MFPPHFLRTVCLYLCSLGLVLLVAFLVGLIGCQDMGTPVEWSFSALPAPLTDANALYPLALGNRWQYVDSSMWYPSDTAWNVQHNPDVEVIGYGKVEPYGVELWVITGIPYLFVRDSAVYRVIPSEPVRLWYVPSVAVGETLQVGPAEAEGGYTRRVFAIQGNFTCRAGTFDQVQVYEHYVVSTGVVYYREYFKPHVGVLAWYASVGHSPDPTIDFPEWRSGLISYSLHGL